MADSETNKQLISASEAAEVAKLARLALNDQQCETVAAELEGILEYMAVLDELDTDDVEPMTHAADVELRLRPDDVGESLDQTVALAGSAKTKDGCFVVPAAIPQK